MKVPEHIAEVELPGIFATIQDEGRIGVRRYGIPSSGALDVKSFRAANLLLGNARDAPAIEVIGGNFSIIFRKDCRIAITGAEVRLSVDNSELGINKAIDVKEGSRVMISIPEHGLINYIALEGGFWGEEVLGSMSTYLAGRFGGSWGRLLNKGDPLFRLDMRGEEYIDRFRLTLRENVHLTRGLHSQKLLDDWLTSSKFIIQPESNRMAYRLKSEVELPEYLYSEIVSIPVFPGFIQLTKEGELLIVNKDGQTTGGYPVIAAMDEEELSNLSQLGPGAEVHFFFDSKFI